MQSLNHFFLKGIRDKTQRVRKKDKKTQASRRASAKIWANKASKVCKAAKFSHIKGGSVTHPHALLVRVRKLNYKWWHKEAQWKGVKLSKLKVVANALALHVLSIKGFGSQSNPKTVWLCLGISWIFLNYREEGRTEALPHSFTHWNWSLGKSGH